MTRRQLAIHTKSSLLGAPRVGLIHFIPLQLRFGFWMCWVPPDQCGMGAAHCTFSKNNYFPSFLWWEFSTIISHCFSGEISVKPEFFCIPRKPGHVGNATQPKWGMSL